MMLFTWIVFPQSSTARITHKLMLVVSLATVISGIICFDFLKILGGLILLDVCLIQSLRLYRLDKKQYMVY